MNTFVVLVCKIKIFS